MYSFVDQKICINLRNECEIIIKKVQKSVSDYFTFQFYLIGSGERRLVTQNDYGQFDLDYNLILMKDKQELTSNPKQIKEIFLKAFSDNNPTLGFSFAKNSTSVITSKLQLGDFHFSFDCAIMCEGNNGNLYKIVFDKPERYLWNEVKHTEDFNAKYKFLIKKGEFNNIKELYLEKKNLYFDQKREISSFSVLVETINEILQKRYAKL